MHPFPRPPGSRPILQIRKAEPKFSDKMIFPALRAKTLRGGVTTAFTLVEMLVVVGIVLILALLSFGSYRAVIEKSLKTASLSNLRSLTAATYSYASERNGSLMPKDPSNNGNQSCTLATWQPYCDTPANAGALVEAGYIDLKAIFRPGEKMAIFADPKGNSSHPNFTTWKGLPRSGLCGYMRRLFKEGDIGVPSDITVRLSMVSPRKVLWAENCQTGQIVRERYSKPGVLVAYADGSAAFIEDTLDLGLGDPTRNSWIDSNFWDKLWAYCDRPGAP